MDKFAAWRVFSMVVEQQGFSAAAKKLGLTGSAVTKIVAQLEQQLNVRLLIRTTRRISMTTEGRLFYDHCREILDRVDDLELRLGRFSDTPRGELHVQMPPVIVRMHLIPRLQEFNDRYPEIGLRVTQSDRRVDMTANGIDAAIWTGDLPDGRLIARRLARSVRVTCAAPSYLERHGAPERIEDLSRHNCLRATSWRNGRTWQFRIEDCDRSVPIHGNLVLDTSDSYRDAALAGLGLAQGSSLLFEPDVRRGALVQVLKDYVAEGQTFWVVYPEMHRKTARVQAFVEFLVELFRPYR